MAPCPAQIDPKALNLINSTVADNKAGLDPRLRLSNGGGLSNVSGPAALQNTILARNTVEVGATGPDCAVPVISRGHNLLGDPIDCTIDLQARDGR
jgi:hypothetical protein